MLPTPKYISIRKNTKDADAINPRRLSANNKEKVKSKLKNTRIKNIGIAKNIPGSAK